MIIKKQTQQIFSINSTKNAEVLVNIAYYPGWEVYVNNRKGEIKPTPNGRFTVSLLPGNSRVELVFRDTFIRKFAGFVSLLSLLFICFLLIKNRFVTINK